MPRNRDEYLAQCRYITLVRQHDWGQWIFHVPNGSGWGVGKIVKLKRMGLVNGIPDICVPIPSEDYHALFIEFKSPAGRQTAQQERYETWCHDWGYDYVVETDGDEAYRYTCQYVGEKNPIVQAA